MKTHWWSRTDLLLILMVGVLLYLPGLGPWREVLGDRFNGQSVGLFDRDEPRFATAARNMLETGDYIVPRFNGQLRPDKPPLVYWVMTATYRLVGVNELGARLPSAIFGTLTLIVVYFAAGSRFGRLTGMLAALMLGACALFVVESRLATADSTMVFFTTLSMAMAWSAWEAGNPPRGGLRPKLEFVVDHQQSLATANVEPRRRLALWQALLFWVALAGGTLTKGVPLAFVFVPMIVLSIFTGRTVWEGNWAWWRQLRPLIGFPLLAVLVGWWIAAAAVQTHGELINQMVGTHFVIRVFGPDLGQKIVDLLHLHAADLPAGTPNDAMQTYRQKLPLFFFFLSWVTFWPWTPLLIPAGFYLYRRVKGKSALAIDRRPYQFLLAWILPMYIALECSSGKLVHYILPIYVAMIILCADMLVASWHRLTDVMAAAWMRAARWVWLMVWVGMAIAALVVPQHVVHEPTIISPSILLAGALFAAGVASTIEWGTGKWPVTTVIAWAVALLVGNVLLAPSIEELRISQRVIERVHGLETVGFVFGASGYEEPTLVFYNGRDVPMRSQFTADEWHQKVDGFFSPGPKHKADPAKGDVFGTPGVAMAMIVDDATLKQWTAEKRRFTALTPAYPGFKKYEGFWPKPKPDACVTIITNIDPRDLLPAPSTATGPAPATRGDPAPVPR